MTPEELRDLAVYHEQRGENALKLANAMLGHVAKRFRVEAARHVGWALGLRELAAALERTGDVK